MLPRRPWHALCADPISGLASQNSKSVEGNVCAMHFFLMHTDAQEVKFHANDNIHGPCFALSFGVCFLFRSTRYSHAASSGLSCPFPYMWQRISFVKNGVMGKLGPLQVDPKIASALSSKAKMQSRPVQVVGRQEGRSVSCWARSTNIRRVKPASHLALELCLVVVRS